MRNLSATKLYALAFGFFLGLCIWKFGDPVILDQKIAPPNSRRRIFSTTPGRRIGPTGFCCRWPSSARFWLFKKKFLAATKWHWLLPLGWLGWQFISATQTVDADLTRFHALAVCRLRGLLFSWRAGFRA